MTRRNLGWALLAAWPLWMAAPAGAAPGAPGPVPAAGASADETILAAGGYWRVYAVRAPGVIPPRFVRERRPGATEPFHIDAGWMPSPPPPAGWTGPEFDDGAWPRIAGPFSGGYVGWARQYFRQGRALICLRGKFRVDDPSGVNRLTLSARYQGGIVVYLNGREVYRAHLPEGPLSALTTAEPYPREAYVEASGKVIPSPYKLEIRRKAGGVDEDLERRLGLRTRSTGRLDLPVKALRRGVNVLALELHRSAFRPEILAADRLRAAWPHVGLSFLRLAARARKGAAVPNIARPEGFQVWNEDTTALFGPGAWGDPNEPLRPVRLVAVKGGYHSAQVVVGSTSAIPALRATVSDLVKKTGGGRIPASEVRIRYPRLTRMGVKVKGPGYLSPAFALLEDGPPGRIEPSAPRTLRREREALGLPPEVVPGAVQPVWVTVHVPREAAAGTYRGLLRIAARGTSPVTVPVEVEVVDWTFPSARDCRAFVSFYQSPETLAVEYGVPLWSAEHRRLMETSWELMGYLGNNLLVVPLVNRTQFGNDECLVPWVKRPDGTYDYDFTAYDFLVGLAKKHCDIRVVSYQVNLAVGWGAAPPDKPVYVTVVDPRKGTREALRLPPYGSAAGRRLWGPFLAALRRRQRELGLVPPAVPVLGIAQDGGIHRVIVRFFAELFPEAKWHYGSHNRPHGWELKLYGFSEYLYVGPIPPPARERRYGWKNKPLTLMSQRIFDDHQNPLTIHTMVERALLLGDNGPGRMCLDYWPVKGSRKGPHGRSLFSRWPESTAGQRTPHLRLMSLPGPAGATPTIKTEAFREGRQEAEARILLEEALLAGRLEGELAGRCRKLLDRRLALCQATHQVPYSNRRRAWVAVCGGWRELADELYRLAGEVSAPRRKAGGR